MKNENRSYKRISLVISLILCWVCLFGGALSWDSPTLNESGYSVYKGCDADRLLEAIASGDSTYSNGYIGTDVCIGGVVESAGSGTIVLKSAGGNKVKVSADFASVKKFNSGDSIRAYGPVSYRASAGLSVKAVHLKTISTAPAEGSYYIYVPAAETEDKIYSDASGYARKIADGRVTYRIPAAWAPCLCDNETAAKIFNLNDISDAECYFLNGMTGKTDTECFVIFDLDYEEYLYDSDKGMTFSIERTIVSNICGEDMKNLLRKIVFPIEKSKNNTGNDADYYVASYNNEYSVEFVFVPAREHMCVMLYIHKSDAPARDDILYLIRTLKLQEN